MTKKKDFYEIAVEYILRVIRDKKRFNSLLCAEEVLGLIGGEKSFKIMNFAIGDRG